MVIFIPFNVPSLKNSKIKTKRGVFPSKTVKKYLQCLGIQKYSSAKKQVIGYKTRPNIFESFRDEFERFKEGKKYPIKIGFHFVRDSKRSFDFHNAVQIIADLMVAHNFIPDDDMDHFLPFPMEIENTYYTYDKESPGVYIKIYE